MLNKQRVQTGLPSPQKLVAHRMPAHPHLVTIATCSRDVPDTFAKEVVELYFKYMYFYVTVTMRPPLHWLVFPLSRRSNFVQL